MVPSTALSRIKGAGSIILPQRKPAAAIEEAQNQYVLSLEDFSKALQGYDPGLLNGFQVMCAGRAPGPDDIVQTIKIITATSTKKHTDNRRDYSTRMAGFLQRLVKLAPVGDVIVGGAQNMAVSGAWGAVRLALEVCKE